MTTLGQPVWVDFGSTDFAASKAFYEQLFGWELTDSGEEMGHYHMITAGGDLVAGGMDVTGMTCPAGDQIPSSWSVFLGTDDIDATFARALGAGATEVMAPTDAGGAGRHAVLLDPTGAAVGLWQGAEIEGFVFSGKPGTPAWFELMTSDYEVALEFYSTVFEVTMVPMGMDAAEYATAGPAEEASFGIGGGAGGNGPEAGWRAYFVVEQCDATLDRVRELGGTVLDGPDDSPFGRLAAVADPAGANFMVISPSEAAGA